MLLHLSICELSFVYFAEPGITHTVVFSLFAYSFSVAKKQKRVREKNWRQKQGMLFHYYAVAMQEK